MAILAMVPVADIAASGVKATCVWKANPDGK